MPFKKPFFTEEQVALKEKELADKIDSFIKENFFGARKPEKFTGTLHYFGLNNGAIYVEIKPSLSYKLFHLKPAGKKGFKTEKLNSLREAALRVLASTAKKP
ncbi:MAG: hypothetical protein ACP5IG_03105 [Candidatus Micrarchaeia archaeon]|jgi:hypothetical protein